MKKLLYFLTAVVILIAAVCFIAYLCRKGCPVNPVRLTEVKAKERSRPLEEALKLLKIRKDKEALVIFEEILFARPDNLDALWGKAEVLRRQRDYKSAENLLNVILKKDSRHISSLTTLAYIRYKEDRLNEALTLINTLLREDSIDKENRALCFLMLGAINGRRSEKGGLFSKIRYGTKIHRYFLKAKEAAPDLPEVHLGLGAFYLLAPVIAGGSIDKAFLELKLAVEIAPEFATANARLAQYYKKKGDFDKYELFAKKAKQLDPENEVLKEMGGRL